MTFFREIFLGEEKIFSRKVILFHGALILMSVAFLYFFSTSTSPYSNSLGDDSAIFQAVGKGWAEGLMPYVDLFENKGALIFLIDALGYMIYPRYGIFLLQIPATYISFLFTWRSLGIFLSGKARIAAALFMFIYHVNYSFDGNRTEEWSMPFLMASTYFLLRGLKTEKFSCPPIVGLINGLGFGVCVMLRMLNAAPLCCCALLSAIFLLRAGEFKVLPKNILNFCAGTVIIVLPFVIYFAAHGALYDAFYGTILLNVLYSAQRQNYLLTHLSDYTEYILINFTPLCLMILIGALEFLKSKSRLAIGGIFIGAAMLVLMFKLSPYFGYCALITPTLPIFLALLAAFLKNFRELWFAKEFSFKRTACKFVVLIAMIYPFTLIYLMTVQMSNYYSEFLFQYNRRELSDMLRLKELIPPEERNSVMCWSAGLQASHWILSTGIMPRCRFFNNVKAFAAVDPNVKREWLDTARADPPKWIIYSAHPSEFSGREASPWIKAFKQNRDFDVERLLQKKYNLMGKTETYQDFFWLYRLKE